jgi:hypothetical protein
MRQAACTYIAHLRQVSQLKIWFVFYVSLTVHLSITVANDQLDEQNF